jgi:hypothetical protein
MLPTSPLKTILKQILKQIELSKPIEGKSGKS